MLIIDRTQRTWAVLSLVTCAIASGVYVLYSINSLNGPSGGSLPGLVFGIIAAGMMVFAGLLAARRRFPAARLGSAQFWLRGHLWIGALTVPFALFHAGFGWGGRLELLLWLLFFAVILSGFWGLALQQILPRMMLEQIPRETFIEQIPHLCLRFTAETDCLLAKACGPLEVTLTPSELQKSQPHLLPYFEEDRKQNRNDYPKSAAETEHFQTFLSKIYAGVQAPTSRTPPPETKPNPAPVAPVVKSVPQVTAPEPPVAAPDAPAPVAAPPAKPDAKAMLAAMKAKKEAAAASTVPAAESPDVTTPEAAPPASTPPSESPAPAAKPDPKALLAAARAKKEAAAAATAGTEGPTAAAEPPAPEAPPAKPDPKAMLAAMKAKKEAAAAVAASSAVEAPTVAEPSETPPATAKPDPKAMLAAMKAKKEAAAAASASTETAAPAASDPPTSTPPATGKPDAKAMLAAMKAKKEAAAGGAVTPPTEAPPSDRPNPLAALKAVKDPAVPSATPLTAATKAAPPSSAQIAELRQFYLEMIRPQLPLQPTSRSWMEAMRTATLACHIRRGGVHPQFVPIFARLHELCEQRRQLAFVQRYHRWLHGWLLVHIPATVALYVILIVHAISALRVIPFGS